MSTNPGHGPGVPGAMHLGAFAHRYAAKFAAETVSYEPPQWVEPTDEAFADCFKRCVRVPPADVYPLIREVFLVGYGQTTKEQTR